MEIRIIKEKITKEQLKKFAQEGYDNMLKAVVDIKKEIMALGGELHSDAKDLLLEQGSKQESLWGIDIYPDRSKDKWIEFNSLVNIRPSVGNRSMGIQDNKTKDKIRQIINRLIEPR